MSLFTNRWPVFDEDEIAAVDRILRSGKVNYWTGKECIAFEEEFGKYTGSKFSISLANGTVALDLALKALEVGPGDEVIVSPRSFIASASCVVNCGATPIFADVDRGSQNITPATIEPLISEKTKAIIAVHLAGWPCDMLGLMNLAYKNGLVVIEDCAQAHGAKIKGNSVGTFGHVGCWSFCQDKIISTGGEGGMVTTNDYDLWKKMWSFKDHGKNYDLTLDNPSLNRFRWLHESIGTNFRMTEMQAAIGRVQLKKLNEWSVLRQKHANSIWAVAKEVDGLRVPSFSCSSCNNGCAMQSGCVHACYKAYVFVEGGVTDRNNFVDYLNNMGVPCFPGSCSEIYLEKAFKKLDLSPSERLPIAKELGDTSVMFLCHPNLTTTEIKATCEAIIGFDRQ